MFVEAEAAEAAVGQNALAGRVVGVGGLRGGGRLDFLHGFAAVDVGGQHEAQLRVLRRSELGCGLRVCHGVRPFT